MSLKLLISTFIVIKYVEFTGNQVLPVILFFTSLNKTIKDLHSL